MKTTKCRSCGKEIVFLETKNGKQCPVNAETVKEGDILFDSARHISHFSDCPDAIKYRKSK